MRVKNEIVSSRRRIGDPQAYAGHITGLRSYLIEDRRKKYNNGRRVPGEWIIESSEKHTPAKRAIVGLIQGAKIGKNKHNRADKYISNIEMKFLKWLNARIV